MQIFDEVAAAARALLLNFTLISGQSYQRFTLQPLAALEPSEDGSTAEMSFEIAVLDGEDLVRVGLYASCSCAPIMPFCLSSKTSLSYVFPAVSARLRCLPPTLLRNRSHPSAWPRGPALDSTCWRSASFPQSPLAQLSMSPPQLQEDSGEILVLVRASTSPPAYC